MTSEDIKFSALEEFVGHFVEEYEAKIAFYNLVLQEKVEKSGKIADTVSGKAGQGVGGLIGFLLGGAVGMPAAGAKGGATIGKEVAGAVGSKLGSTQHSRKVQSVSDLVRKYKNDTETFRRNLVEAGLDVFQSFEMQFNRVTGTMGTENALMKLARDAVNRSVSYYSKYDKGEKSEATIAESVLLGSSKIGSVVGLPIPTNKLKSAGYEIIYEYKSTQTNWLTSSLYEKAGIFTEEKYFSKKDSSSKVEKYGYRRLLTSEKWCVMRNDYVEDNIAESKSGQFTDYVYSTCLDGMALLTDKLLRKINSTDTALSEDRIKNLIQESVNQIISEINSQSACLENIGGDLFKLVDFIKGINFDEYFQKFIEHKMLVSRNQKTILDAVQQSERRLETIENEFVKLREEKPSTEEHVWFNVKVPVKSFTGRNKEIENVHRALQNGRKHAVISQTASICGLGGIGKSELARKYVIEFGKCYDNNVLWIDAETKESLHECFKSLSKTLFPTLENYGTDSIEKVYTHFKNRKCLFVFDNVEDLTTVHEYLPFNNSFCPKDEKPFVLITSRNQEWDVGEEGDISVVELDEFSSEEAFLFIKTSLKIENASQDADVRKLAEEMQYFPLALEQAVAYIREANKKLKKRGRELYTVKNYVEEIKTKKAKLLAFIPKLEYNRYLKSVFNTWEMTLETVKSEETCGECAMEVFYRLAYFVPDNIGLIALSTCFEEKKEEFWDAIDLLSNYSMIRVDRGMSSIHRLVQFVSRENLKNTGSEENLLNEIISSMLLTNWTDLEENYYVFSYVSDKFLNTGDKNYKVVTDKSFAEGPMLQETVDKTGSGISQNIEKLKQMNDIIKSTDLLNSSFVSDWKLKLSQEMLSKVQSYVRGGHDTKNNEKCNDKIAILINEFNSDLFTSAFSELERNARRLSPCDRHINSVWEHAIDYDSLIERFCRDRFGSQKRTLLHIFVKYGHERYIERVLSLVKIDNIEELTSVIDAIDGVGDTPLHDAISYNKLNVLKLLIENGANLSLLNRLNYSPLETAAILGNMNIVRFLVENKHYTSTTVCISDAVYSGKSLAVKYLAENGFDLNGRYRGSNRTLSLYDSLTLSIYIAVVHMEGDVHKINLCDDDPWEMVGLLLRHKTKEDSLLLSPKEAFLKYLRDVHPTSEKFLVPKINYEELRDFIISACCMPKRELSVKL